MNLDPNILIPSLIAALGTFFAARASKQTRSTGNGFAKDVRADLRMIQESIENLRKESREDWRDHYNNHHKP